MALGSSGHKKKRAREKETRVSPSRAPVLSFAHYFQAPAAQANFVVFPWTYIVLGMTDFVHVRDV